MTTRTGLSMMMKLTGCLALAAATGCLTMPSRGAPAARYRPVEARPAAAAVAAAEAPPAQTPAAPDTLDSQKSGPLTHVLRNGDRLDVSLRAIPQPENFTTVVDENGNINLPYIGDVQVEGKTAAEAQKLIEQRYISDKIYKFITVIIVPPPSEYSVSGEVLYPKPYPLTRDLTLLQALSRAGRFTEFANPAKIKIIRKGKVYLFNFDRIQKGLDKDPIIEPGDIIEVPRGWY
jgi:protein involved in polysaccharide export with SLBB domain